MARKKSSTTKLEEVLEQHFEEAAEIFDLDSTPEIRSINEVSDADDDLRTPETRTERYLAQLAGLANTMPENPFTRLERYLEKIIERADTIEDKVPVAGMGENILINSDFRNPVNQRGLPSYSGNVMTLDRWKGSTSLTVDVNPAGYITVSSGGSSGISFYQPLEFSPLKGLKVTGSVLTKDGTLYTATGTVPSEMPASGASAAFSINTSVGLFRLIAVQARNDLEFTLGVNSGKSISIVAAKLELGDTQTLVRNVGTAANPQWVLNCPPPDFATELMKCQRYLLVLKPTGNNALVAHGFGQDSTHYRFSVPTPVTMLSPTSVTMTGQVQILANGAYKDVNDLTVLWGSNGNSVNIVASLSEASSAFELYGYAMLAVIGASSSILISAES